MEKKSFDCIIIGGGPGGYVAAIRMAQLGFKTALIENIALGGTCLNRGCIPSKTLIAHADVVRKVQQASSWGIKIGSFSFNYGEMAQRKEEVVQKMKRGLEGLIAANQITYLQGYGKFLSPTEIKILGKDEQIIEGKSIIIATGSEPRALPNITIDHQRILDSTSLLQLKELPKKMLIVGGGVIGCEFASLYHTLGVDVTIIEMLPHILSTEGKQMGEALAASFKKRGLKMETQASVKSLVAQSDKVVLGLADGRSFEADCALVSVGRKFNTDQIHLESTGVIVEKNGTIPVNDYMQTNIPHIYAIGDVTGKWILAHVASHQGLVAADHIAGHATKMSYLAVPSVVFTYPEIASVGMTLETALSQGIDAVIGKYPFQALGKSQASFETEGFAQIVIHKKTGQILGAQVMGYGASQLIAEMVVAIQNELTIECITETIHAHPSTPEAWLEAAFLTLDRPLHYPPKRKS